MASLLNSCSSDDDVHESNQATLPTDMNNANHANHFLDLCNDEDEKKVIKHNEPFNVRNRTRGRYSSGSEGIQVINGRLNKEHAVVVSSDSEPIGVSSPPKKKKFFAKTRKTIDENNSRYSLSIMNELKNDLDGMERSAFSWFKEDTTKIHIQKKGRRMTVLDSSDSEPEASSGNSEDRDDSDNQSANGIDPVDELFSRCRQVSENLLTLVEKLDSNLAKPEEHVFADSDTSLSTLSSYSSETSSISFDRSSEFKLTTAKEAKRLFPKNLSLKHYQLVGLNWMQVLYQQDLNGILADEMGLGKTVQAIALLSWLKMAKDISGPHLIIAPASTLENWRRELERWAPQFRVVMYHGSKAARNEISRTLRSRQKALDFDILISTYTYFERDVCSSDRSFLTRFQYQYIILDEAHGIKSINSSRYRRMSRISSYRRLLLTGTPIQNNLQELLALMSFCMPKIFDAGSADLTYYFRNKGSKETERIRMCMRPFVLRRQKSEVLSQLCPKVEEVRKLKLTENQQILYDSIIARYKESKNQLGNEGQFTHFFSELRKATNHPLLVQNIFGKNSQESPDGVDRSMDRVIDLLMDVKAFGIEATRAMIQKEVHNYSDWALHGLAVEYGLRSPMVNQLKLSDDVLWQSCKAEELRRLLPELIRDDHRVLIFSQWTTILDLIEKMVQTLHLRYLRFDGQTDVEQRQKIIDHFNTNMEFKCCLLSTRAGGLGINLNSADTVILHDLDFNPALDRQAEDRCHRIGQTKTVRVIKLISAHSIDEKILQMQKDKKELDDSIVSRGSTPLKPGAEKTILDPVRLIMEQI